MKKLRLFYDKKCGGVVPAVRDALETVFKIELEGEATERNVSGDAYDINRRQYDASILLNSITRRRTPPHTGRGITPRSGAFSLWIVSVDIFVRGMNFVFGIAQQGEGAVLSTYRLDSLDLIKKEAIHEMGHVFGLQHCSNECVMRFSNSVYEAKKKPSRLCAKCKRLLQIQYSSGYRSERER